MILLIDNYDSFTYNLYQYVSELGEEVIVKRNDQITIEEIQELQPSAILLSPGPGEPEQAGICTEVVQSFYKTVPILGVCLGHQAIGAAFGAKIVRSKEVRHGKTSQIQHNGLGVFQYVSQPLEVMRYHSLVIEKGSMPPELRTAAVSMDDGEIMAIQHHDYPLYGMQFHPESIGTRAGKKLLENFLELVRRENEREKFSTKTM